MFFHLVAYLTMQKVNETSMNSEIPWLSCTRSRGDDRAFKIKPISHDCLSSVRAPDSYRLLPGEVDEPAFSFYL